MDIGEEQPVIVIEPVSIPVPDQEPAPVEPPLTVPDPEPALPDLVPA